MFGPAEPDSLREAPASVLGDAQRVAWQDIGAIERADRHLDHRIGAEPPRCARAAPPGAP